MGTPRITQKEIARQLGITQASVSLALARHNSISLETQERVIQTARKLGYKPDPYLSGLAAYRKQVRPVHFEAILAWLSNYPDREGWRRSKTFRGYFEGAERRAQELGYQVEEHWLHSEGMTSERMKRILQARNINGLLLSPQPQSHMEMDFPFDRFSSLTFGYTLKTPKLHLATLHQFRSIKLALRKLLAMGYRKPGLALAQDSDQRSDENWSAGFWSEQRHLSAACRIPPLLPLVLDQKAFLAWFKKYRPDVVLAIWPEVYQWLLEAGESVPATTGFAMLSIPDKSSIYSGIWENPQLIGAKAVEFLIDMIHRKEYGIPEVPLCVLVEGSWCSGHTLRSSGENRGGLLV